MKFILKTKKGWRKASLKVREVIGEDQLRVLKAVFEIEGSSGSLVRDPENPMGWGYASRKWICKRMGVDPTDSNMRGVSYTLRELEGHGYLKIHKVAFDGNTKGANYILLLCLKFVTAFCESLIYKIDHVVGVCGLTFKSLESKPLGGLWERASGLGLDGWRECRT